MAKKKNNKVTPIRTLKAGESLEIVRRLRTLSQSYLSDAFLLHSSFEELGGAALEEEAVKARHTLELASARISKLVKMLEATDYYKSVKEQTESAKSKENLQYTAAKGEK